jgi:hypothetical protein
LHFQTSDLANLIASDTDGNLDTLENKIAAVLTVPPPGEILTPGESPGFPGEGRLPV